MTYRFRILTCAIATVFAMGLAALAQVPPSGAFLAGTITEVTPASVTIQGMTLTVNDRSKFFSVLPDGAMAPIPFAEVPAGMPIHARFIFVDSVPTLVRGELGSDFFWHGIVTALGDGSLTLDGAVNIHTGQARTIGSGTLQVGSTVGVKGEVLNGVFAARVINTSGLDFAYKGTITALVMDDGGKVAGFTFGRGETSYTVVLDSHSIIWRGRRQLPPGILAVEMRVDVDGWTLPDGSVLAWNVRLLK